MANMFHKNTTRQRKATRGARFDLEEERILAEWIEKVTQQPRFDLSLFEWLHSGQILCHLVNRIRPKSVRVSRMLAPAKKLENIKNFLLFASMIGVKKEELFEPNDLFERNNLAKVVTCLYAFAQLVAKVAPENAGLTLELPGIFAGYYRSHFNGCGPGLGMDGLYQRFAVPVTSSRPLVDLKPDDSEGLGALLSDQAASVPSHSCKFLPSTGTFHGPAGSFGGMISFAGQPEPNTIPHAEPDATTSLIVQKFLPSTGAFHGAVGAFGGVAVHAHERDLESTSPAPSITFKSHQHADIVQGVASTQREDLASIDRPESRIDSFAQPPQCVPHSVFDRDWRTLKPEPFDPLGVAGSLRYGSMFAHLPASVQLTCLFLPL